MPSSSICSCPSRTEQESIKQYSFSIFQGIAQVSELQWNQLIPEANMLMQYDQLSLIETVHQGELEFKYVFIKKENTVVGVAYFQIVRFTGGNLLNYFPEEPVSGGKKLLYRIARALSEPLIKSVDVKLLVSGNVFMTGENGFYFQHDIEKPTRASLLRKAIAEAANTDKNIRAVLISDFYEPETDFNLGFRVSGYHKIIEESDMSLVLNSDWLTFDNYLNALSSKYRVRAKKAIALCAENNVTSQNLSQEDILANEDRLFELYRKVMNRAEFKLAELNKSFFSEQKKRLPNSYFIQAYFKDGQMIGFLSCYLIGKKMEVHYTGMDAEICKPLHLYQHMLYDMIKFGIEHKAGRMHFGRTAPEIKSTIGAVPAAMYGYVKHFNPLFNFLAVRTFTARLKPQEYTIRNPFK